jgi:hypothetical protein
MDKKGSALVLFAILGFVILISGGFLYYLKDSSITGAIESEVEKRVLIQNDVRGIKFYIEANVHETFVDGLFELMEESDSLPTCTGSYPSPHDNLRCGFTREGYNAQPDPYVEDIVPEPLAYTYGVYSLFQGDIAFIETWLGNYMSSELDIDFSEFEELGYNLVFFAEPEIQVKFNQDDVGIELIYPMEVERDSVVAQLEYFKYIYDYDLYDFLSFVIFTIKGLSTEISNLYYSPVLEFDYLVERIPGVDDSYDVIKITNEDLLLTSSYKPFSVSYIRENRPPDANTVYFTNSYGVEVSKTSPIHFGDSLVINCPNFKNIGEYADPDEDD